MLSDSVEAVMRRARAMKNAPRFRRFALTVHLVLGLSLLWFLLPRPPEHDGRSLREWLRELELGVADAVSPDTESAFAQMDAAVVPHLMRLAQRGQLTLLEAVARRIRNKFANDISEWRPDERERKQIAAIRGLGLLGTNAIAALPLLQGLATNANNPRNGSWSLGGSPGR